MKSKIKKHLKKECENVFSDFLNNGELEKTKKEVESISNHFENSSLETIRDKKRMINEFFSIAKNKFKYKSIMIILAVPGHGGLDPKTGKYVTPGKRSPIWSDGRQLFEGVFNREVVSIIGDLCKKNGIEFINIVPDWQDITLGERARRVKKEAAGKNNVLLLEIHANAAESSQANGFEFFTTVGETPSDNIADVMIKEYAESIPSIRLRKGVGNSLDKDVNFYLIKNTEPVCPSILIECAFMTNEKECKMMMDEPCVFARAIFNGIKAVNSKFG